MDFEKQAYLRKAHHCARSGFGTLQSRTNAAPPPDAIYNINITIFGRFCKKFLSELLDPQRAVTVVQALVVVEHHDFRGLALLDVHDETVDGLA